MREIKFRVWNGKEIYQVNNRLDFTLDGKLIGSTKFKFMQYTGLKDKNGVEIFEDDIVYCNDVYYEVIWETAKAVVFKISKSSEIKYPKICKQYFGFNANDRIEVVGNIYEHSHLLDNN